jgi:hypothetical protein
MAQVSFYANYGELAHEKQPVFKTVPGEISNKVTAELPDGWLTCAMADGKTCVIAPWGWHYALDEVLIDRDNVPCLSAIDASGQVYCRKLAVL